MCWVWYVCVLGVRLCVGVRVGYVGLEGGWVWVEGWVGYLGLVLQV